MYLPVTYAARAVPPGMGLFRRIDPAVEEAEFYPAPYDFLAPPQGLGDVSDYVPSFLTDEMISGIPNWMLGLGVAAAFAFIGSRSGKRDAMRKAGQRYQDEVSRISKEYTVRGRARRIARRIPRVRLER